MTAPEARQGKAFEFIHTADALLMLSSGVPAKNVGAVVDLWDVHVSGGSLDALKKLGGERLIAVRWPTRRRMCRRRMPDDTTLAPWRRGAIDSSAALVALAEMGFDGPVTPAAHADSSKACDAKQP